MMKVYGVYCGERREDSIEIWDVEIFAKRQDAERFAGEICADHDGEYSDCTYVDVREIEVH